MSAVDKCQNGDETTDSEKLLEYFPTELWMQIFSHINDPQDLSNLSGSSPFFAGLLQPIKAEKLFPAVWDILGPVFHKNAQWFDTEPDDPNSPASKIMNKAILSLRSVNKSWRDAIATFYYTHTLESKTFNNNTESLFTNPTPDPFPWSSGVSPFKETFSYNCRGAKMESIPQFLAHFESTHSRGSGGAWFARHVELKFPLDALVLAGLSTFDRDVTELFRKYGQYIQICEFKFLEKFITKRKYIKLRLWLSLLPNVVCLEINFEKFNLPIIFPLPLLLETTPEQTIKEIRVVAGTHPFPKLEKLEYLNLFFVTPVVCNLILEANTHVTHLRLNPGSCENAELSVHTIPLPNLTQLEIAYPLNSKEDYTKLETAQFSELFNSLSVYYQKNAAPIEGLFKIWGNKWRSTLTHLKVFFPAYKFNSSEEIRKRLVDYTVRLQKEHLPAVTRLQIYIGGWF